MKRIVVGVLFLAALVGFTGCDDEKMQDGTTPPVYVEYYMDCYSEAETMSLKATDNGLVVYIDGEQVHVDDRLPSQWKRFKELSERNGDYCNRKIPFALFMSPRSAYVNFVRLDVQCDRAWDATHPAGSSLNDLFRAQSSSFAEMIRSEYRLLGVSEVDFLLSDAVPEDLKMLNAVSNDCCSLVYTAPPAEAGDYTLTVTMETDEGVVLTQSAVLTFE